MFKIMFYAVLIILILIFSVPQIQVLVDGPYYEEEVDAPNNNEYAHTETHVNFLNKHFTDYFLAKEKQDLVNIIFTVLNSGVREFTFYCAQKYNNCLDDLEFIHQEFTYFNSFLHPYNNYYNITINYDSQGRIDLKIFYLYSPREIEKLNKEIKRIWDEEINEDMTKKEKIRAIHDYILITSNYDRERADAITNNADYFTDNNSHKATGPLFEKMAICSGYSDAMSLFLYKMELPNYRISNDTHIWNYVNIDNNWYHLDLTWNNPSADDGTSIIIDNYFLISSDELVELNNGAHYYDTNIYVEAR